MFQWPSISFVTDCIQGDERVELRRINNSSLDNSSLVLESLAHSGDDFIVICVEGTTFFGSEARWTCNNGNWTKGGICKHC